MERILVILLLAAGLPLTAHAEILALYTFTGSVATPETTQPFVAATPVTLSTGTVILGTSGPGDWTGSGVPYAQGNGGWTAPNQSSAKHFLFTLSELNGATFTPTNISLRFRATEAGPEVMGISLNGSSVHTESAPGNTTQTISVPLSGFNDLTQAVLRIEGWLDGSRTSSGGGQFRIDDVLVEGTVDEPVGEFPPSVSAPVSPSRTATTLELGGTITATGGPEVTERGVYYSTTSGFAPPGQGTKVSETGTFDVGSFAVEVTGLDPDTEYFFRAFATNAEGTGFSDEASRRTLKTPPPDALAFYTFTDDQLTAEVTNVNITATEFAVSAGTITFGTANAATWTDLDAELPYVQSGSNWITEDQETAKHYRVDLSVAEGRVFTITNISFIHRRTSAGPAETGISIDGASIYTNSLAADSTLLVSIPVIGYANLTSAVIRIEGWNASGAGSYQIDNVLVQGTVGGDVPPTVTDPTVSDIEGVSAVLGGTITDEGDAAVTERGAVWSTQQGFDPETGGTRVSETGFFGTGPFTVLADALTPDSMIYYRAFASNFAGIAFSEEDSFMSENNRLAPYGTVWVNEINYRPTFFDTLWTNEFVEIAGPTTLEMTGWAVELYSGANIRYARYVFPEGLFFEDQAQGFGFYVIGDTGVVANLSAAMSTNFTHTAQDRALTSAGTIRVMDANTNEIYAVRYGIPAPTGFPNAVYAGDDDDLVFDDQSLALFGTGTNGLDFTWGTNTVITAGAVNPGQILEGSEVGPAPEILIVDLTMTGSVTMLAQGIGSWNAVPEYTTNLVTAVWNNVSPFTNQQAGGTNTFTFSEPTTNQPVLYRLRATE